MSIYIVSNTGNKRFPQCNNRISHSVLERLLQKSSVLFGKISNQQPYLLIDPYTKRE
jgi:hypothetical protein